MTAGPDVVDARDAGGVLTLGEAAEQLGVHYMTAYRYVQLGRLHASKVGGAWAVPAAAVAEFGAEPATVALPPDQAIDSLTDALVAGDEATAWSIVEPVLRDGERAERVHVELIAPAMARIGHEWELGKRSIADEHRASAVARRLLGRIRPTFLTRGRRRGVVVVAAPSGDHHSLPVSMFADLVRANGCDVYDLGAQTPTATLLEAADRFDGQLVVCLTISHRGARSSAASSIAALVERYPSMDILVGGGAVGDEADSASLGARSVDASDAVMAAAIAAELASAAH